MRWLIASATLPLAIAQAAAAAWRWTLQYYFKSLEEYDLARHPPRSGVHTRKASPAHLHWPSIPDKAPSTRDTWHNALSAQRARRPAESGVPTRWLDPLWDPRNEAELLEADRDMAEDAHRTLAELIDRSRSA